MDRMVQRPEELSAVDYSGSGQSSIEELHHSRKRTTELRSGEQQGLQLWTVVSQLRTRHPRGAPVDSWIRNGRNMDQASRREKAERMNRLSSTSGPLVWRQRQQVVRIKYQGDRVPQDHSNLQEWKSHVVREVLYRLWSTHERTED